MCIRDRNFLFDDISSSFSFRSIFDIIASFILQVIGQVSSFSSLLTPSITTNRNFIRAAVEYSNDIKFLDELERRNVCPSQGEGR